MAAAESRFDVFVSYSHNDDTKWVGRIRVHLARLIREGRVELWDDTRIKAGERWREEIQAALARARIAVLLISADFYASDFIANDELPPLLEAERERGLVILGVHINYSSFDSDRTLSEYQTINPPSEPLESLTTKAEREKVFDQLRRRIEELLEPSGTSAASSSALPRLGRIYGDVPELPPDYHERSDPHAEQTNKQGLGSAAKYRGWKITLLVISAGIITVWITMVINRDPLLPDASEPTMFLIAGAAMIVTWLVAKLWWFR